MQGSRWYPTGIELADGRVLAAGGTDWTHTFEVFDQYAGWGTPIPTPTGNWPAYPNMLLMRDGRLFFTGIHFDSWPMPPAIFDVAANALTAVPGLAPPDGRGMGSSVILPPAQAQRVMVFGGGGTGAGALKSTSIVDLSVAAPHYVNGPDMKHPRTMQNTVILPDRSVFVSGGGQMGEDAAAARAGVGDLRPDIQQLPPSRDGNRAAAVPLCGASSPRRPRDHRGLQPQPP